MHYLARNPRRALAALATALMAVAVAAGSGATFTTHKATAANVVASGSLVQDNDKNGLAIYTGSNLKPGDTATGTVTVTNSGTLAGDFKLIETDSSNGFSDDMMTLRIVETRGADSRVVYNDDIDDAGTIALGRFKSGETRTYSYVATFNSAAVVEVDALKTASAKFSFDSTQSADQSTAVSPLLAASGI